MDSVGSVYLDLNLNQKPFNSQLAGVGKTLNGPGGISSSLMGIGKAVGVAFAVRGLLNFTKAAIKLGSDLNEVQNVVDVTFGQGASVINDFAKTAANAFGLSELAAKQYTGTMGAMLKSMGLTGGSASSMSMELAGLAGDMASFYNLTTDEAFGKIRSGISGETEPLKQLGINLSVANLEAFALSQGMKQSYQNMGQANQALLRYNYLLSVTADAQGDFARTSGSWANQTRLLTLQWDSFKAAMGQGFINLLTPVLQWINTLLPKLIQLGEVFRMVTAQIFGDAGESIASIAVSSSDAGSGMDNLAGGIGKAGKAASKSIAPFDQLNKLTDSLAASGGGGGGSSVMTVTSDTQNAISSANTLKDKFLGVSEAIGKIVDGVGKFWSGLKEVALIVWNSGLKQFWLDIGEAFTNIWNVGKRILGWLNEVSKWAGGSGNIVKDVAWLIGKGFELAGAGLKEVSIWLSLISEGDWAGLGNRIKTGFTTALDWINSTLTTWSNGLPNWAKVLLGIDGGIITTHTSSSGATHGGGGRKATVSGSTTHTSSSGATHGGGGASFTPAKTSTGSYGAIKPIAMADGAIVSRPTLAIVGDNRRTPEAVMPLNQLDKYTGGGSDVSAKLDRVIAAINDSKGAVNVYIDGVLERQVEYARRRNARAGRVVIPVGGVS